MIHKDECILAQDTSDENSELEKIEIELLLDGIFRFYGFDFRNYVYPSIRRRIWHRIRAEKLTSISALQDKVLHNPLAMEQLFADFSINVTEMFRDPAFFQSFRTNVIPLLKDYHDIRIWHAGCSTGEEIYSMAILLYEEGLFDRTRIYATDMSESVLRTARQGIFPLNRMQLYTRNYLQAGGLGAFSEYYTAAPETVTFHPFLRENVTFFEHNLATDGSFNDFHVIICRNVLIYFNKSLQSHVHNLIYESLHSSGILGLGNKEGIVFSSNPDCYEEIDANEKIYRKIK